MVSLISAHLFIWRGSNPPLRMSPLSSTWICFSSPRCRPWRKAFSVRSRFVVSFSNQEGKEDLRKRWPWAAKAHSSCCPLKDTSELSKPTAERVGVLPNSHLPLRFTLLSTSIRNTTQCGRQNYIPLNMPVSPELVNMLCHPEKWESGLQVERRFLISWPLRIVKVHSIIQVDPV